MLIYKCCIKGRRPQITEDVSYMLKLKRKGYKIYKLCPCCNDKDIYEAWLDVTNSVYK